eukprot:2154825-Pleurochrysis_carterae.AAC.4
MNRYDAPAEWRRVTTCELRTMATSAAALDGLSTNGAGGQAAAAVARAVRRAAAGRKRASDGAYGASSSTSRAPVDVMLLSLAG